MGFILSIDGPTRKVYLNPAMAVGGVLSFHPILDIYPEYKALRASTESIRPFNAFMSAQGNLPKGEGKFTPRYLLLLENTKLVIPDGIARVNITGEVLTDNETDPIDYSLVTGACALNYKPSEAEVIKVTASGNEYSLLEIQQAVWAYLKTNPSIPDSFGEHVKSLTSTSSTVHVIANTITRTIGSDQGGDVTTLSAYDDSYHITGEVAGQGLTVTVTATSNPADIPLSCKIVGYYSGSSGHFVTIQAWNYLLNAWEDKGQMLLRTTPFEYVIPLSVNNHDSNGDMQIRFIHSVSTYINTHRLRLDYIEWELNDGMSLLAADIAAIKNKTDQLSFIFNNISANTQSISTAVSDQVRDSVWSANPDNFSDNTVGKMLKNVLKFIKSIFALSA
jgi:hypothetical protein